MSSEPAMRQVWVSICLFAVALRGASAAQCACSTTDVHVRSGVGTSHSILGTLSTGNCVTYKGDKSSGWVHVDYKGQSGWIAGNYVRIQSCGSGSGGTSTHSGGCPNIVSRSQWGARSPKSVSYLNHNNVKYAFIHHGESGACSTQSGCSAIVRSYQNYHMDTHGWSDIGYSFLVGEDGNAYEGRGWDRVGAHTQGYNSVGLGFCMIGNFMNHVPNSAALTTVQSLIACGVSMGKIKSDYILRGHRDMGSTDCPGTALYNLIRTWSHY